jgi:hypothetical protein
MPLPLRSVCRDGTRRYSGEPLVRSKQQVLNFQLKRTALSPRSRQAGSGDRDDLGQPSPDPGRRAAQKCTYLSHLNLPSAPAETGRTLENGPTGLRCRDAYENSNARFVRKAFGSGFIAVIEPATGEIFSPVSGS